MWTYRDAQAEDAADIAALERAVFPDPWTEHSVRETMSQNNAAVIGAWDGTKLAGYVILYCVLDEGEIARIAVEPLSRRQGVAGQLLDRALKECDDRGIIRLMLEVRESNKPAVSFYKKCGFTVDGLRKGYYANPKEDALLMSKVNGAAGR